MIELRPLRWPDELPRWSALHTAIHPDRPLTAGDLERLYSVMQDAVCVLALDGDETVGIGAATLDGSRPTPSGRVLVLPGHRRRGVGSALLAEVTAWAAALGCSELEACVREIHPEGLAFATHHGFVEIGRNFELELDLTSVEPPPAERPDGIEIVTWAERPELTEGFYEAFCDSVRDSPGEEEFASESMDVWLVLCQGIGISQEATFLALAGDEVAGYAMFFFREALPGTANHAGTGVRRAWRGRGIARALKVAQIRWAKEAGYERLVTHNEERNGPILHLNERFGYRPLPGEIVLRGPVARP